MKLKNRSNIIKIQLEVRDKNVTENFRNVKSFLKILVSTWSDFEKTVGWCWIEVDKVKPHAIYVCHMPSNLHPLICSYSLISITLNRSSITWASVLVACAGPIWKRLEKLTLLWQYLMRERVHLELQSTPCMMFSCVWHFVRTNCIPYYIYCNWMNYIYEIWEFFSIYFGFLFRFGILCEQRRTRMCLHITRASERPADDAIGV